MQNVSILTILVMGKGGVGKSSTVNSIIGEKAVAVSTFQVLVIPVSLVYLHLPHSLLFAVSYFLLISLKFQDL